MRQIKIDGPLFMFIWGGIKIYVAQKDAEVFRQRMIKLGSVINNIPIN